MSKDDNCTEQQVASKDTKSQSGRNSKNEEDVDFEDQIARLRRFYGFYAPDKVPDTWRNVTKYASGSILGGIPHMWAQLEKRYGLESDIPSTFVTLPEPVLAADDIWNETASAAKHETYPKCGFNS